MKGSELGEGVEVEDEEGGEDLERAFEGSPSSRLQLADDCRM